MVATPGSKELMATVELEEFEPNRWRVKRSQPQPKRSDLPLPNVISDHMEPTEQVDGRFYTSKRQFRAVGRALGLTEVGNEKFKPHVRSSDAPGAKTKRREALKETIERYQAGQRPRTMTGI